MSKQTEAMKLALGALELGDDASLAERDAAITALREALAEQPAQQEPVAHINSNGVVHATGYPWGDKEVLRPLVYGDTTPQPPAQAQPLTDEEIWREYQALWPFHPAEEPRLAADLVTFARAIEAAHGITKGNT